VQNKHQYHILWSLKLQKDVLHINISVFDIKLELLVLRVAAILKIQIYERSGDRPLRRPGYSE
jgi:hypothetical protein